MTLEASIDEKGRIVIPIPLRRRLKLQAGTKVKLTLEGTKVILTKPTSTKEFIEKMEGCIKESSQVPKLDPLELKKIWEQS